MSKTLKVTFLVHMLVGGTIGVLLLVIPGRFLSWLGWQSMLQALGWESTDPFLSRVLGAGLLALAWSSFRGRRASHRTEVASLLEMEAVFTVLGCAGLLRHLLPKLLLEGWAPAPGWTAAVLLAVFAVLWVVALTKE